MTKKFKVLKMPKSNYISVGKRTFNKPEFEIDTSIEPVTGLRDLLDLLEKKTIEFVRDEKTLAEP
jgi:hypothetical protein